MDTELKLVGLACVGGVANGSIWFAQSSLTRKGFVEQRGQVWVIDGPLSAEWAVAAIGNAIGIIARSGGFTCHGANIAREARIPTVTTISDFSVLRKAKCCVVDGYEGTVLLNLS